MENKANNSAPIPADHSTWGSLEGLLLGLRVPPECVCLCVSVCVSGRGGVGGQCAGSKCWRGTFTEFQRRTDQ